MPGTGAASPFRGANMHRHRPANMLLLLMAPLTSVMMLTSLICTQERYRLQQPASFAYSLSCLLTVWHDY